MVFCAACTATPNALSASSVMTRSRSGRRLAMKQVASRSVVPVARLTRPSTTRPFLARRTCARPLGARFRLDHHCSRGPDGRAGSLCLCPCDRDARPWCWHASRSTSARRESPVFRYVPSQHRRHSLRRRSPYSHPRRRHRRHRQLRAAGTTSPTPRPRAAFHPPKSDPGSTAPAPRVDLTIPAGRRCEASEARNRSRLWLKLLASHTASSTPSPTNPRYSRLKSNCSINNWGKTPAKFRASYCRNGKPSENSVWWAPDTACRTCVPRRARQLREPCSNKNPAPSYWQEFFRLTNESGCDKTRCLPAARRPQDRQSIFLNQKALDADHR